MSKERPIIMSEQSVRAILEGRKTQTRRIIKPLPVEHYYFIHPEEAPGMRVTWKDFETYDPWAELPQFCPYGKVGDRLWVRESYRIIEVGKEPSVRYMANCDYNEIARAKWKTPMFMPKALSRIMLEITNIRVERLGEITEKDAIAEGISTDLAIKCNNWKPSMSDPDSGGKPNYLAGFWHTWDSIHKIAPHNRFLEDPWVWVLEFKVVKKEIT